MKTSRYKPAFKYEDELPNIIWIAFKLNPTPSIKVPAYVCFFFFGRYGLQYTTKGGGEGLNFRSFLQGRFFGFFLEISWWLFCRWKYSLMARSMLTPLWNLDQRKYPGTSPISSWYVCFYTDNFYTHFPRDFHTLPRKFPRTLLALSHTFPALFSFPALYIYCSHDFLECRYNSSHTSVEPLRSYSKLGPLHDPYHRHRNWRHYRV